MVIQSKRRRDASEREREKETEEWEMGWGEERGKRERGVSTT